MSANDRQVAGSHYNGARLQHWDYVMDALSGRYLEGNITKYVCRHRKKNGVQDLEKALHYLDKLIEMFTSGKVLALDYRPRSMSFPMAEFIAENGLNSAEAFIVKRIAYWYTEHHLLVTKHHIQLLLTQAEEDARRMEHIKAGGFAPINEEPGAGYTNQD